MESLDINTILHTKDGRKIGNAIITGREGVFWKIMTDYGNEMRLTSQEIEDLFFIGWVDCTKDKDGYTCNEMQEMMSADHKHNTNKNKKQQCEVCNNNIVFETEDGFITDCPRCN